MVVKNIAVLGSTGSVGVNTLDVIAAHPDRFRAVALAAHGNHALMVAQARRFQPEMVALRDAEAAQRAAEALAGTGIPVLSGMAGVVAVAQCASAQLTLSAIVGAAGLEPTLAAVRSGKDVALANKECLVMAGNLFMEEVPRHGVALIPVDSEHNAIFQVLFNGRVDAGRHGLEERERRPIRRLILTASGGPFRGWNRAQVSGVTVQQALNHPNWNMGRKITIDSATIMNKGLEVIEAYFLFGLPADQVTVVVHPESIVHSMVAYEDGSVLAQMGVPDMRTPIAVALAWPDRVATSVPPLDLVSAGQLRFFDAPDADAFPCLGLAYRALERGGNAPAVLNAANEVAVAAFLDGRIGFLDIPRLIECTLETVSAFVPGSIEAVMTTDQEARHKAGDWVSKNGK